MRFFNIALFVVSVLLFIYVCSIGIRNYFRYNGFKLEQLALQEELIKERRRNLDYKHQLLAMEKPEYWELQAKNKLGFVKKGEKVFKIVYIKQKN